MRKKMEWQWEKLDEGTLRAKVIGGWIVRHWHEANGSKEWALCESMVFVADRDHEWHIVAPVVMNEKHARDEGFEPK